MARFLNTILLAALLCSSAGAQYSLSVRFAKDTSRSAEVGSFIRGGILYGSLGDLAGAFRFPFKAYRENGQCGLWTPKYGISITAANPYIVITDRDTNTSVFQMSANVLLAAGAFFVPVEPFIDVLNDLVPDNITYDEARRQIAVGRLTQKSPYDITGVTIEQKSNGSLLRLQSNKPLRDYESWLKPAGNDTWLYITIADARAHVDALNATKPQGLVRKVIVFQSPTSVQLTILLRGKIKSTELMPEPGSDNVLVAIRTSADDQAAGTLQNVERTLERERSRWKLDCIVIDPGHGGDDPGTIGVTRTKEKDITLAIGLKLGRLIEKNLPGVRVIYTRRTDEFVEVYRRGQIANNSGGKLFISIHCNAMPSKPNPTGGFEIYLLRPGKTENALRIAERENAVVKMEKGYEQRYQQLTEEHFILLTMAQSAYVKYSEQFADILQREMGKHLDIDNNGVKQAGFYVLVGASMPNVLVETAYLSNRANERMLKSQKGQQRMAEAIFNAVKGYKQQYEKSLLEGKDPEGE